MIVGEPPLFGKVWGVIKMILPRQLRESVMMLGNGWSNLANAVAGEGCEGVVSEAMKEHARQRSAKAAQSQQTQGEL